MNLDTERPTRSSWGKPCSVCGKKMWMAGSFADKHTKCERLPKKWSMRGTGG
jgi:hypothetical protein